MRNASVKNAKKHAEKAEPTPTRKVVARKKLALRVAMGQGEKKPGRPREFCTTEGCEDKIAYCDLCSACYQGLRRLLNEGMYQGPGYVLKYRKKVKRLGARVDLFFDHGMMKKAKGLEEEA